MFFMAELESEARSSAKKMTTWRFQKNNDIEMYIQEVIREAGLGLYSHVQSLKCPDIGRCSITQSNNLTSKTYLT